VSDPTDTGKPMPPDTHEHDDASEAETGPATERPLPPEPGALHEEDEAGPPVSGETPSPDPDAELEVPLSPDPSAFGPDDDFLDRTTPGMRTAEVIEAVYRTDAEVTVNLTGDVIEPPDPEMTVNLTGELFDVPLRDDLEPLDGDDTGDSDAPTPMDATGVARAHLKGLIEALVFASDSPVKTGDLAKSASAQTKEVKDVLVLLKSEYASRGLQLDEVAGGWIFRTNAAYAPFVRDLTKQKPVKLTRAQIETLAILAYRQPITRPEIDEIRGVDSGPVLKMLLERDLVRILGKKDEPGRPLLYGTTAHFLEFFGLKSLKDLPTLREFTELNEDSRRVVEKELGETLETVQAAEAASADRELGAQTDVPPEPSDSVTDTIRPARADDVPAADEDPTGPADDEAAPPAHEDAAPPAGDDAAGAPAEDRPVIASDEEEFPDDDDDAFDEDEDEDADEDEDEDDEDDEDDAKDEKP
jgi:segregation and condensation protein B